MIFNFSYSIWNDNLCYVPFLKADCACRTKRFTSYFLTLKQNNNVSSKTEQKENVVKPEIIEVDEKTADVKYREGLSLYAKGKYFEAERMWELTLRLNPNHIRAQTALNHIRNKNTK